MKKTGTKREILRGKAAFEEVFKHGRFKGSDLVDIVYLTGTKERGVAFAAKRKIRSAVKRNAIKRRLREVYRIEKKYLKSDLKMVLIGSKKVLENDFNTVCNKTHKLFHSLER